MKWGLLFSISWKSPFQRKECALDLLGKKFFQQSVFSFKKVQGKLKKKAHLFWTVTGLWKLLKNLELIVTQFFINTQNYSIFFVRQWPNRKFLKVWRKRKLRKTLRKRSKNLDKTYSVLAKQPNRQRKNQRNCLKNIVYNFDLLITLPYLTEN